MSELRAAAGTTADGHWRGLRALDVDALLEGRLECLDAELVVVDGVVRAFGDARTVGEQLARMAQSASQFASQPAAHPVSLPAHDAQGALLTPGLVDCHTHLVYGGLRSNEFAMRLAGASYEEIARAGGGIVSTVDATRRSSVDDLVRSAWPRLRSLLDDGVCAIEIKSGYGLEFEAERRQLLAARALGARAGVAVRTSFLGAHAVPREFKGRADDYIDELCAHMLPALAREGLVDAVDAYCENIGFSLAQTRRVFEAARGLGLPVKLHAEQLSDMGGAAMAAGFGALSCDHIEHLNDDGIAAMKRAGSVAVLLPGAYYTLRDTHLPPIDRLRAAGVPMAISTDHNPGTSPALSLLLMMNMATTLFRLTVPEVIAGVTVHAARALGLQHTHGRIHVGAPANFALWAMDEPSELAYWFGQRPLLRVVRDGRLHEGPRGSELQEERGAGARTAKARRAGARR